MRSERKHGLSTEQVPVSAYVGSSKNLKDLKDLGNLKDLQVLFGLISRTPVARALMSSAFWYHLGPSADVGPWCACKCGNQLVADY